MPANNNSSSGFSQHQQQPPSMAAHPPPPPPPSSSMSPIPPQPSTAAATGSSPSLANNSLSNQYVNTASPFTPQSDASSSLGLAPSDGTASAPPPPTVAPAVGDVTSSVGLNKYSSQGGADAAVNNPYNTQADYNQQYGVASVAQLPTTIANHFPPQVSTSSLNASFSNTLPSGPPATNTGLPAFSNHSAPPPPAANTYSPATLPSTTIVNQFPGSSSTSPLTTIANQFPAANSGAMTGAMTGASGGVTSMASPATGHYAQHNQRPASHGSNSNLASASAHVNNYQMYPGYGTADPARSNLNEPQHQAPPTSAGPAAAYPNTYSAYNPASPPSNSAMGQPQAPGQSPAQQNTSAPPPSATSAAPPPPMGGSMGGGNPFARNKTNNYMHYG